MFSERNRFHRCNLAVRLSRPIVVLPVVVGGPALYLLTSVEERPETEAMLATFTGLEKQRWVDLIHDFCTEPNTNPLKVRSTHLLCQQAQRPRYTARKRTRSAEHWSAKPSNGPKLIVVRFFCRQQRAPQPRS